MEISKLTTNKIWLAPLAGITDSAFRTICKELGADVVLSEMVSVDGLTFKPEKTLEYAEFTDFQRPFGLQIFGHNPERFSQIKDKIALIQPDFVDINMGCPVKKVVKRGAGSALMQTPKLAAEIVSVTKKFLEKLNIPLSVKIRAGWDTSSINAVEYSKIMQDAGADIVCVHPRTRSQMFEGHSDWSIIRDVKAAVSIPIIGNGDIRCAEDAKQMREQTNCDSVMIGRGSFGKPWIFSEIKKGKILSEREKFAFIKKHFDLSVENKGERVAVREMRTHFSYYTKGYKGGAKTREFINKCTEPAEIIKRIKKLLYEKI
jgi:tRNA-dihydrouridine synthase B